MKSQKIILISTLLLLSLFVSSCSSTIYSSTGWHGIAAASNVAYLAAGNQVYAVDLNTGNEKWRYPEKADPKTSFYANPVLTEDGQLLLASYDHHLYSINPDNRSQNWVFQGSTNRLIASPLVAQNLIFQPSSDGMVYAIDLKGNQVWVQETGGQVWAQPASDPSCGCIYVASMDHKVYSYDAQTGKVLWISPDLEGAIVGTPAIGSDGTLYVGTFNKEMISLDTKNNGEVKKRFTTQDWVWAGPVLADDVLYFGDLSGYFYALNATDLTALWRIQRPNAIVDVPAIAGNNLYFTTETDALSIVSKAGDIVSSPIIGGAIYSAPVIVGDVVLVAPTGFDSLLVAMDLNGVQKWPFKPAK